jgi:hypothetical protein
MWKHFIIVNHYFSFIDKSRESESSILQSASMREIFEACWKWMNKLKSSVYWCWYQSKNSLSTSFANLTNSTALFYHSFSRSLNHTNNSISELKYKSFCTVSYSCKWMSWVIKVTLWLLSTPNIFNAKV